MLTIWLFLRVEQEVETAGEMAAAPDARPRDRRPDRRSRSQVAADVAQAGFHSYLAPHG